MAEFNLVIEESAQQASPEMLCFGIFGISLDELANNILRNKDGEFDELYK